MDMFKFVMLILYTMVLNNVPSNGNSAEESNVEIELNNILPVIPPGFHFVPSACLLILDYLVKKIIGAPLASDMVKVRDGIQLLDPEQHEFDDEFAHCQDNQAYYITNKAERTIEEEAGRGGGSITTAIIKTRNGYWREKKRDIPVYNGDNQIIGYKTRYVFFRRNNVETSWRMDEFTANPETVPAARNQIQEYVACRIRVKLPKTPEGPFSESEASEEDEFEDTASSLV